MCDLPSPILIVSHSQSLRIGGNYYETMCTIAKITFSNSSLDSSSNCISLRISDEPPLQPLRGAAGSGLQCGGSGPVRGLYGQHQL